MSQNIAFRVEYISYMYGYIPKHTDIYIHIDSKPAEFKL